VAETSDGQEAIALTRKFKPNALLLDLAMTRAFQLGARGVVLKASPPDLLLRSIRLSAKENTEVGRKILAQFGQLESRETSILTAREVEVISAIKAGNINKEIAVKRHLSNIYAKQGVSSRLELAFLSVDHDLPVGKTKPAQTTLVERRSPLTAGRSSLQNETVITDLYF